MLLAVFLVGFAVSAVHALFTFLVQRQLPAWPVSYYVATPFVVGTAYLVAEFLWQPLDRILIQSDRVTDPWWRRVARVIAIILIGCAVIAVGLIVREHAWGWP